MQIDTVKQIMRYYGSIFVMRKLLNREKDELDGEYNSLRGSCFDGMPRGSGFGSSTERAGMRAAENDLCGRIADIEKNVQILETDEKKIKACLDGLNGKYKRVLEMRYLRKYSWVKISMQMYVPESTARHWHQRALERMGEALESVSDVEGVAARASRARP